MKKISLSIYLAGAVALGLCFNVSAMNELSTNDETSQRIDAITDIDFLALVDAKVGSAKTSPQIEQPNNEKKERLPFPPIVAATPTLTPGESYFHDIIIFHDNEYNTKQALKWRLDQNDPFDIEKKADKELLRKAINEDCAQNAKILIDYYLNDSPLKLICMGNCLVGQGYIIKDNNCYRDPKENYAIFRNMVYEWLSDSDMLKINQNGEAIGFETNKEIVQILLVIVEYAKGSEKKALEYINDHYTFE